MRNRHDTSDNPGHGERIMRLENQEAAALILLWIRITILRYTTRILSPFHREQE